MGRILVCQTALAIAVFGCSGRTTTSIDAATVDTSAPDTARLPGTELGPCYGNGTCNAGLICASGLCVKVPKPDLGKPDLPVPDAQVPDAQVPDAQVPDLTVNLPANLIGWWKFDEGTGLAANDSVGNNHGTLVNGALWATGKAGGAVKLDGVNDYVSIPDSAVFDFGTGDFSATAWFSTVTIKDHHILNFRQNDNNPHIEIYAESVTHGYLGAHILPGNVRIKYVASKMNDGKWHHAAITLSNGVFNGYKLFLDGVMVGQTTYSGSLKDWDTVKVGDRSNGDRAFSGSIDEVMVFNRALSDKEIQQVYQYGLGSP